MVREEAIRELKSKNPGVFLDKAKKRGYICPICGNGSGRDGDGIVVDPKTKEYKCFKCSFYGDIIDLIGKKFGLTEFNDQFDKACSIYGITVDDKSSASNAITKIEKATSAHVKQDFSEYYAVCHGNIEKTSYMAERGISKRVLDAFSIGYDERFDDQGQLKHAFKAIIFPTSKSSYEVRNISVEVGGTGFRYCKHGETTLFNVDCLTHEKEKPIIVVEGIIDALSIIEAGGQAIGLSSANNGRKLLEAFDQVVPSRPLILCLDSDSTGKDCEARLADDLSKRNVVFMHGGSELLGTYHDPNDRLINDRNGLINAILSVYKEAESLQDPAQSAKDEYLKTSAGHAISALRDAITANAGKQSLSTGIKKVDEALDGGLYSGLYFIGAISSLGKTTLAIQIADNLAKQGCDVLFFSLEQSRFDIMSKSISRETFLYCIKTSLDPRNAKSNLSVLDGRRWSSFSEKEMQVMESAFQQYEKYAGHLFIYEGVGNIRVSDIREKIKNHTAITGNRRPVVFIDYLQILKAAEGDERATDKQVVDHNVTALKQLSRDFDIPILAVSSLNRDNYNSKINMAAFKESGAIEYGSDVLIGLQFGGAGEKDFDVNAAKAKDPRLIELFILKNRNGKVTSKGIPLQFYPMFNCFIGEEGIVDFEEGFFPVVGDTEKLGFE